MLPFDGEPIPEIMGKAERGLVDRFPNRVRMKKESRRSREFGIRSDRNKVLRKACSLYLCFERAKRLDKVVKNLERLGRQGMSAYIAGGLSMFAAKHRHDIYEAIEVYILN